MTTTGPGDKTDAFVRLRDTSKALASAGRYSRRVWLLRWLLPVLVLGVIGALIAWPLLRSPAVQDASVAETAPDLILENLNYSGMDSTGNPYTITAQKALQAGQGKGVMDLDMPAIETTLTSGAWVSARSVYGRYDEGKRRLFLSGAVQVFHDAGYQFTSNEAEVDLASKTAWGDQPVLIQGPFGEIWGQGFRILQGGKVLVVKGKATAYLSGAFLSGKGGEKGKKEASLHQTAPSDTNKMKLSRD